MAKSKGVPIKEDPLRWKAEDLVRSSLENTPAYKKAVRQAMKEMKTTQRNVKKTLRGK
jgi:hypothetical protein